MYWSRKWKVHNCKPCNYIGIAKNAKSVCVNSGDCTMRKHGRDGSLHTVILPDDRVYENVHCPKERTNKYLIKSGQQPNNNESKYSYGYNNYLKNKRKMTYEMKLPTSKSRNSIIIPSTHRDMSELYAHLPSKNDPLYGHGGKCDDNIINGCNLRKTTAKFSNKKYYKQGAVDSSDRIRRLKLNRAGVGDETQCNICPNDFITVMSGGTLGRAPHYNAKEMEKQWMRINNNSFHINVGGHWPWRYKNDSQGGYDFNAGKRVEKLDVCKENRARRRVLGVYKNNSQNCN